MDYPPHTVRSPNANPHEVWDEIGQPVPKGALLVAINSCQVETELLASKIIEWEHEFLFEDAAKLRSSRLSS